MTSRFNSSATPKDDLIARYIHAIGKYLPLSRRDDILAELSANLHSEVEEREDALGRRLTRAEQAELLKTRDRPFLAAARYQRQQYLIGPAVFPYYWLVLRISLVIFSFVYFLSRAILIATAGVTVDNVVGAVVQYPFSALITAAWVTGIFIALEFAVSRYALKFPEHDGWKPESLPEIAPRSPSHLRVLGDLLAHLGGALYIAVAVRHPFLFLGPGSFYFTYGPVRATPALQAAYWPIVALLIVPVAIKTALFLLSFRRAPITPRLRMLADVFSNFIGLVMLFLVIRVHDYFTVIGSAADQAKYSRAVEIYNSITAVSLRVGFAIVLFTMLWSVGKHLLRTAGRAPGLALNHRS